MQDFADRRSLFNLHDDIANIQHHASHSDNHFSVYIVFENKLQICKMLNTYIVISESTLQHTVQQNKNIRNTVQYSTAEKMFHIHQKTNVDQK